MTIIDVAPIEIRDYAQSYGWTLVREALNEGLFVLNSPDRNYKQLIFPTDSITSDYKNLADIAISKIADYTHKSTFKVIEEIREVNDDVLSLRYYSESKNINSLSFQEALESIEATKQMILAAGSSVISPVLYHKRMSRSEAVELLKRTRFRHTEEGSFILKISCPIQLENSRIPLFGDIDKPISRKAFEILNIAAFKLLKTIEQDSYTELLDEQKSSSNPIISYNLCDSLTDLFDDERELPFELRFNWSRGYMQKLPPLNIPNSIKFPYSFKTKLDEIKNYFKPESKELTDVFFGTVESLNGNEGDNGKRHGEVMLSLIIEGEIVNARVNLDADLYEEAYKSHGKVGSIIKVKGRLLPGKRFRILDEVTLFESISK